MTDFCNGEKMDSMPEEAKRPEYVKLRALLEQKKPKKVAMFCHVGPDPDALGSMMAMG